MRKISLSDGEHMDRVPVSDPIVFVEQEGGGAVRNTDPTPYLLANRGGPSSKQDENVEVALWTGSSSGRRPEEGDPAKSTREPAENLARNPVDYRVVAIRPKRTEVLERPRG